MTIEHLMLEFETMRRQALKENWPNLALEGKTEYANRLTIMHNIFNLMVRPGYIVEKDTDLSSDRMDLYKRDTWPAEKVINDPNRVQPPDYNDHALLLARLCKVFTYITTKIKIIESSGEKTLKQIYPGEAMFRHVNQSRGASYGHAVATYGQTHNDVDCLTEDYNQELTVSGSKFVGIGAGLFGGSGVDLRTTSFERFLREVAKASHEVVSAGLNPSSTPQP